MPSPSETRHVSGAVREAVDLSRLPWIRPLVKAYADDYASVASLFAGNPADSTAWRQTIERVQRARRDRAALAALVGRQLDARNAPTAARQAAATLADPAAVAIVTGQQAGLFGGPLYTLLKAVTAIQLARRVREEHGVPAVPVFWVDAEDHDWEEVRTASVLDANFSPADITLADVPGAGTQPVASLILTETATDAVRSIEAVLARTEFTAEVVGALGRRYRPGAGMATSFAGWIDDLLGAQGLVVFEAADPAAKPLVSEVFVHELTHPCRTTNLAREAGAAMARLGHAPQVEPADDAVALFYLDAEGRRAIRYRDREFVIGETTRPAEALRAEAESHPERFSPNVLLRPLVQDRLFPTICYVSGPSELAYQAQLGGVYREFGVEAPLLYSRATATLLDSAAVRFLDRHHLPLEALHAQDESALNRLLESQLPPTVERALDDTDRQMAERSRALRQAVVGIDPTLGGAVDTTLERMRETLKSLHTKIIQATKRKDDTLRRQFQRTRALTFPAGHPQERTLGVTFFLNRYGLALGERLLEVLPLETDKHYILTL
ncbi:MAG: bacillithiol biosynthesis cysteine-adding enzyme BshC [Vicinamibacterales bacterium]